MTITISHMINRDQVLSEPISFLMLILLQKQHLICKIQSVFVANNTSIVFNQKILECGSSNEE